MPARTRRLAALARLLQLVPVPLRTVNIGKVQPTLRTTLSNNRPDVAVLIPSVFSLSLSTGEWVCSDCGYVYDQQSDTDGRGLYFEQQQRGYKCPQCQAPRKRFAKKLGDEWGATRDGGNDLPLYAFTAIGLAATLWFALVYVPTL